MTRTIYRFDLVYPGPGEQAIPRGAVVVEGGRIAALVPGSEVPEAIDLGGVALPGFIDSHVHLTATGLDILALDAARFDNIPDFLDAISHLDGRQQGLVRVWGFDTDNFRERRYPTLAELDAACPHNMLWINHIESHGTLVNSNSLAALGVQSREALLVGRDNQHARSFFLSLITDAEREQAIRLAAAQAVRQGITTLHAMEGGSLFHNRDFAVVHRLSRQLPVEVVLYPQVTDVDQVRSLGLKQIGGCLPLDGSSGVYTAALTRPYYRRSDRGVLYYHRRQICAFVLAAQRAGMQTAMHACGDAAIDLALDAIAYARKHCPEFIPHRIEHFELPRADQVSRCLELGVVLSMQPAFDWFWGGPHGDYARTLGPDRWQDVNPVGWAVAAGLVVAGGSDSDVTPLAPLLGVHAAVNHHNRQQRVNLNQALAMFTEYGAIAARLTDRGRLARGLRADMVVLGADPWQQPLRAIKDLPVVATIVGGQLGWHQKMPGAGISPGTGP